MKHLILVWNEKYDKNSFRSFEVYRTSSMETLYAS